ncbi:DUF664 domain-containing protein [Actinotalea sp. K2]|uniref:mycothiol transferase n=1 Tax=Actinotalea sp. K2 TaxID=2939438 RepID=UPI002017FAC4|nr:DUF664 domain-containing protein [Actinotalea sp. K2]MCL3862879.1 DinB family protein [Actinotalea sp. K2]
MDVAAVLLDAFGRVRQTVHDAVDGLTAGQLAVPEDGRTNSIAWLVWHLTRVQDDHLAQAFSTDQVWTTEGWAERFELPFDAAATGYGQDAHDVSALAGVTSELLLGYHDAVHARTVEHLATVTAEQLDRVVDEGWDPPVTLGVRLVSVLSDDLQHAGQAGYLRGVVTQADAG